MIDAPSRRSGNAFCTLNSVALDVDVEVAIEFVLGDLAQPLIGGDPGVGEHDVEALLLLFDGRHDAVEIGGLGHVAHDAGDVLADRGALPDRAPFAVAR